MFLQKIPGSYIEAYVEARERFERITVALCGGTDDISNGTYIADVDPAREDN